MHLAVCCHDVRGLGATDLLVGPQPVVEVAGQLVGKHSRVDDRLRTTVGANGIHRMGRIAEQRHPAMSPPRQHVPVDHRILQHGLGPAHEIGGVQEAQVPALQVPHDRRPLARLIPFRVTR